MAKPKIANEYTADHIVTNEGLDVIRCRPTGYIGTRDNAGQVHTAKEILDNSNDELALTDTGAVVAVLFRNRKKHKYQLLISDTGRGIPVESGAFLRSLTVLNTSGKYTGNAYRGSSGLFGVGGKVPAALSTRFKAISCTRTGTGMLYLNDSNIVSHETQGIPNVDTGVSVIYELDPQFFRDIPYFMETGYLDIITLFKLWGIFCNIRYIFKIVDAPIKEDFWTAGINESVALLNSYTDPLVNRPECTIAYDSDQVDSEDYIFEFFNAEPPITWRLSFDKNYRDSTDRIAYKIKMFTTKKLGYSRVGLINNIIPKNQDTSSHIKIFYKSLYKYVAPFIENKELQTFFLASGYKLPVFVGISTKYDKSELGGMTKDSFEDSEFEAAYEVELMNSFANVNQKYWSDLVNIFLEDLQEKYNKYHNKNLKAKNTNKLTLELNYPDKFFPCEITGPNAELFIVEGDSASNIKDNRDSRYQAIYCTRGKPKNIINSILTMSQSSRNIRKNSIYQDLIKILGIDYNDPTLSKLNYGKIILTMDADPDGAHIVSLHTGDIYALNPKLIELGFVWIATPPLYTMKIGNSKQKKYLRDYVALMDSKINFIYNTTMHIDIKSSLGDITPMTKEAFRDFCYMVNDFGNKLEYSSALLGIPPLILERLVHGLHYLIPHVCIEELGQHFGANMSNWFVRLNYFPERQILVLSEGDKDYPISLLELDKEIRANLLPYVHKFKFDLWAPVVTSKLDPVNGFNKRVCTIMQVYLLFKSLDKIITIERLKGLGRMAEEDVITTLIDSKTRSLWRVSGVGEIERICELMGDDSRGRKELLSADGLLGVGNFEM